MPRSVLQQILTKQKEADCLLLRIEGKTFEEIAEELGYSGRSGALKAYRRALNRLGMDQAEEAFALHCARLDAMLAALWPKVEQGDGRAIGMALGVMERMDELHGLDVYRPHANCGGPDPR